MKTNSPWKLQKQLMEMSDQNIQTTPHLTNTSILYAALILEETSELLDSLVKVIDRIGNPVNNELKVTLVNAMHENHIASLHTRKILAESQDFSHELLQEEAVSIADATTDIAVVNSGFCLASGFDGDKLYAETVGSNLSKANPDTGKIDKTPDGKWIKGRHYWKPDLYRVIYDNK